jgi:uncharacterized protein YgiM (DUF1202 family)
VRISLARAAAAIFLALGLLFVGSGVLPATASSPMTATEGVNVRSGPSTTTKIVGGLYRGQTVNAISNSKGWVKITYAGKDGYVSAKYLVKGGDLPSTGKVNAGVVKSTTTAVNLRKGPGLSYDVIKVLKQGTRVTLTGKTAKGYVQVVNGSSTGYVSSQYLTGSASGLPAVIGTRIATAALDIRTTSGSDSKTVAEVKKGTKLSVTGATANGRAQIIYKKAIRWVTAKYLANPDSNQPSAPGLPKVTGTRYATAVLDIRSTSADKYTLIAEVPRGTKLSITGVVKNGRMQIIYLGAVRWVTNKYLSKSKPSASSPPPGSAAVEKGLQPNAIKVYRAVIKKFPQIKTVGGKRPDSLPDHPSGRALDIMVPNYKSAAGKKLGGQIAAWARANARSLGINYVIWNQHIWNINRDGEGWRYMASRGSDSANHKNHVHVTVFAAGFSPR